MRDFQQLNIENLNIKIENICRTSTFDNIDIQKLVSGIHSLTVTFLLVYLLYTRLRFSQNRVYMEYTAVAVDAAIFGFIAYG
jgi:hypothetical protein